MKPLCIRCENHIHTIPSTASFLCNCKLRTCSCSIIGSRIEIKEEKVK